MAQNFLACDRDRELLLPPSLRDWLPEEHLARFVLDSVAALDLDDFYAAYRSDGWGAAAHDPQMMVALLLYGYSVGVRSARAIERRCAEDVAFRVITANQVADHATIARFRARHEQAIAKLFSGVLSLCARAGLVKLGIVAVDGTKIAAAATHHANRSYEQIAQEILAEAGRIDAAEDELYGEARGEELPRGAVHGRRSAQVAARGKAGARGRARGEGEEDSARSLGAPLRLQGPPRAGLAARAARRGRARGLARARHRIRRLAADEWRPREHQALPAVREARGQAQRDRPRLAHLKTTRGWVQGYNAQAAVTPQQIVIAAEISTESLDTANLEPMVASAGGELRFASVDERPGVVLADAGYWKNDAIEAIVSQGIQTLIAPTPTVARSHAPAAAAASITSRAGCSRPTGASSST